ncbi:MAG: VOC family protein, partial [Bacteroidota bacterium]
MNSKSFLLPLAFLFLMSCGEKPYQFELGSLSGFAELVNSGVKRLALSSPMSPADMDKFFPLAQKEAEKYGVSLYREKELIVTDLFPADVAEGKEVLLIYQGKVLDEYDALKQMIHTLKEAGKYDEQIREEVARRFGRLLSYTPQGINKLLKQNTSFRTMKDFGIRGSNVFFYYKNLQAASKFYKEILGLEMIADYGMAHIYSIAGDSFLILVDAEKGMHTADEPKTVALALLTNDLDSWYKHLRSKYVKIKYPYKPKVGGPHDGFVAIDPEGYLLEFEKFKQHPENEKFIPLLSQNESSVKAPGDFYASITWLYYKDVLGMQKFYEEVLGLELVADQGWTKIYQLSQQGFIGLVDEARGMHDFTEEKGVTVSYLIDDLKGWYEYVKANESFELRTGEFEIGPEEKYNAFVGYDPAGYFMEFDKFLPHPDNETLMKILQPK